MLMLVGRWLIGDRSPAGWGGVGGGSTKKYLKSTLPSSKYI